MTPGSDLRPVRRLVRGRLGDAFVVEVRERTVVIRPKGSRRGGKAEVTLLPGLLYLQAMRAKLEAEKAARKKARRAGRVR